jgi:hypothetical protein
MGLVLLVLEQHAATSQNGVRFQNLEQGTCVVQVPVLTDMFRL